MLINFVDTHTSIPDFYIDENDRFLSQQYCETLNYELSNSLPILIQNSEEFLSGNYWDQHRQRYNKFKSGYKNNIMRITNDCNKLKKSCNNTLEITKDIISAYSKKYQSSNYLHNVKESLHNIKEFLPCVRNVKNMDDVSTTIGAFSKAPSYEDFGKIANYKNIYPILS